MGQRTDKLFEAIHTLAAAEPAVKVPSKAVAKPRALSATTGWRMPNFFQKRVPDRALMEKYWTMYEQGGMISEAVDCYPLYVLAQGGRLEGDDQAAVDKVQDCIDSFSFNRAMSELVTDAIVCKNGFQEIAETTDGGYVLKRIDPRTVRIVKDKFGTIEGYEQYASASGRTPDAVFEVDEVVHFEYKWLLHRAYDDIMRDTRTAEATATAIERHGFRKYHVRLGVTGEAVPTNLLTLVSQKLENLKTDNEITTPYDVLIAPLDDGGLGQVKEYNDVGIQRVCSAMGVPEEMLGLGRGSTEATANVRLQSFYTKTASIQSFLADCICTQFIDKITIDPGVVWWAFNDPNPTDDLLLAQKIQTLRSNPLEPVISVDEAREWLGMGAMQE